MNVSLLVCLNASVHQSCFFVGRALFPLPVILGSWILLLVAVSEQNRSIFLGKLCGKNSFRVLSSKKPQQKCWVQMPKALTGAWALPLHPWALSYIIWMAMLTISCCYLYPVTRLYTPCSGQATALCTPAARAAVPFAASLEILLLSLNVKMNYSTKSSALSAPFLQLEIQWLNTDTSSALSPGIIQPINFASLAQNKNL